MLLQWRYCPFTRIKWEFMVARCICACIHNICVEMIKIILNLIILKFIIVINHDKRNPLEHYSYTRYIHASNCLHCYRIYLGTRKFTADIFISISLGAVTSHVEAMNTDKCHGHILEVKIALTICHHWERMPWTIVTLLQYNFFLSIII